MKICIDPGHGGHDSGADGPSGLHEADINLLISELVAIELETAKVEVKLTRSSDVFIELGTRCKIANDWAADYFVSIHCNSNGETANGIETLYTSEAGKALAAPIQAALIYATGETDRGLKARDDLAVLNGTNMPAALVEVGFISHPVTEVQLAQASYQQLLARAIVEGLIGSSPKPLS